ncbi:MAG: hypothetical protein HYZ31_14015 [Gammaproteobacteria bacterium]|nr:hypothetical protein [Gammaproteobacteria bacterium]
MTDLLCILISKWNRVVLMPVMIALTVSCDNANQPAANNNAPDMPVVENAKANIKFSQDTIQAKSGMDVVVTIQMSDLPATEGGGISLAYDSSLVNVSSVQVNQAVWKFVNTNGVTDNVTGKVNDILFSSYNAVPGNAEIATITIHPLKAGISQIVLSGSAVNPFASNGEALNVSFGRLQVNATAN